MTSAQDAATLWEPPLAGSEVETWLGSLERQRKTLAWKCGGLDAAAMQTRIGRSEVTLGGLLKHLAMCEDHWFSVFLLDRPYGEPWRSADWAAEPQYPWTSAARDTPEELFALWTSAVERSRTAIDEALAAGEGLDVMSRRTADGTAEGDRASLRRILADLVEEYARHVGHADLIRESVDGLVGEDPPH